MVGQESKEARNKIRNAWLIAAGDLGIDVIAPFVLETDEGRYSFIALVRDFGSPKGTLIGLPGDWETLGEIVTSVGYYFSCLYESYETYERQLFIDTLDDWQWFGGDKDKPTWYTGKSWS